MDALKIALETVFVGALALPWLVLAAQFFFPEFSLSRTDDFEGWVRKVWLIKSEVVGYTVVGVLSVALAYTLGASLARLAQDFFNDDDLLLRAPTEDQIRTSVYCNPLEFVLVASRIPFQNNSEICDKVISQRFPSLRTHFSRVATDQTRQIFSVQEAALLLAGEDKVSRLRLIHQQIMVLRGAAFDGLITWILCVLGWNATQRWGLWQYRAWRYLLPVAVMFYAFYAFGNHFALLGQGPKPPPFQLTLDDPPFTEITLLLLGVGGCYVVFKEVRTSWPRGTGWVSFLFTVLAYSGWYWTEILYDRMVIYSFYAVQNHLLN